MERQEFSQNGICHLMLEREIPSLPDGAAGNEMRALIEKISALVKARAEAMLPVLSARYEQNENPKKHLLHRPLLLSLSFSLESGEGEEKFMLSLRLSQSGREIRKIEKAARIDRQSGRFLYEEKEKPKKKRK